MGESIEHAEKDSRLSPAQQAPSGTAVTAADRWLVRRLLELSGRPALRLELWNGERFAPEGVRPVGTLRFRSRGALLRLLVNPELNFGEAYSRGEIVVDGDLVECLEACYRGLSNVKGGPRRLLLEWLGRPRANTLSQSRHNIHQHYDIGNHFYGLWLDREMQYTCAYYPTRELSLEEAQLAKLDHVCRKLRLKPGETVFEAGCGWGGLARFMAREYGVRVRAFNISREQVRYARERARAEGLEGRVEYVEDDYRNIDGRCDAFVSVGMLEHVGRNHYRELGGVVRRCLGRDGRGLIHTIGRNRPRLMNPWIEKHIFPGAYPPTLGEMMEIFEPHDFSVLDVENLRLHYARTLREWLARFEGSVDQVRGMFDERFVRTWRLYLAGSIAAFENGDTQLFQVLFAPGESNEVPWTRAHLHAVD